MRKDVQDNNRQSQNPADGERSFRFRPPRSCTWKPAALRIGGPILDLHYVVFVIRDICIRSKVSKLSTVILFSDPITVRYVPEWPFFSVWFDVVRRIDRGVRSDPVPVLLHRVNLR